MEPIVFETLMTEEIYAIPTSTLVLLGQPWKSYSEAALELLTKILVSIRESPASVRVVHMKDLDLTLLPYTPERVMGFGVAAKGMTTYELIETPATKMVLAEDLESLINNDGAKKKLWMALKTHFSR